LTVLIIQYQTPELTRFCLRSLWKHTDPARIKVIVVDNHSQDESIEYLRGLRDITLIERPGEPGEPPAVMHAKALDLGFAQVTTPYVLSIHTDTIIRSDGWLDYLLGQIEAADDIAGVGSWKLEVQPPLKRAGKAIEHFFQRKILFPLLGKGDGMIAGAGDNFYYLRSHCALYRTELVRRCTGGFHDGDTAGRAMHRKLTEQGYRMIFLEPEALIRYLCHLNHATMVLNPEISGKKTGTPAARRRIERALAALNYREMLADDSLDR
jgi:GT2 family glycosyltransferase